jgi:hypothetical protein
VTVLVAGCESGEGFYIPVDAELPPRALRIYSNPYEAVDWANDRRLIAQHHDHVARIELILAYDAAGYDVVSLMDYSGNPLLPWARRERLWPPDRWVAPSQMPYMQNLELILPNAEEVGINGVPMRHVTSPFLTTYIEGAPDLHSTLLPNQYRTLEEMFAVIRSLGGFPCIAHPWNYKFHHFRSLEGSYCIEIYNAFAEMQRERGTSPYFSSMDRNQFLVSVWDSALEENPYVLGIAVNDHVGPHNQSSTLSNKVRDSGKIVVIAKEATLDAYRKAFTDGSFFAVRDFGEAKSLYPEIQSIAVEDSFVFLETSAAVNWISQGRVVASGPTLYFSDLPEDARYARAEVSSADGSIVYTQAFAVAAVGDVDGDQSVTSDDVRICRALTPDSRPVHWNACRAAGWLPREPG